LHLSHSTVSASVAESHKGGRRYAGHIAEGDISEYTTTDTTAAAAAGAVGGSGVDGGRGVVRVVVVDVAAASLGASEHAGGGSAGVKVCMYIRVTYKRVYKRS
jgi:hypothetical protein